MYLKKIFISFDFDNDRHYRYLLLAMARNPRSYIEFEDFTPREIQSNQISRIKSVLTTKIRSSTHTLVIIGKHANSYHPNNNEIGERNWQWWEIRKSIEEGKKLIAVKTDRSNNSPDLLLRQNVEWAFSYTENAIWEAIQRA